MQLKVLGASAAATNQGQGCRGYPVESGTTRIVIDRGFGTFTEVRLHIDYLLLDAVVL